MSEAVWVALVTGGCTLPATYLVQQGFATIIDGIRTNRAKMDERCTVPAAHETARQMDAQKETLKGGFLLNIRFERDVCVAAA